MSELLQQLRLAPQSLNRHPPEMTEHRTRKGSRFRGLRCSFELSSRAVKKAAQKLSFLQSTRALTPSSRCRCPPRPQRLHPQLAACLQSTLRFLRHILPSKPCTLTLICSKRHRPSSLGLRGSGFRVWGLGGCLLRMMQTLGRGVGVAIAVTACSLDLYGGFRKLSAPFLCSSL